ncbi:MAG: tetratricopeptide repeat protein [Acidiphilium sp.]
MKRLSRLGIALFAAFVLLGPVAHAAPTPQQLQTMIAGGHAKAALADLKAVLRTHPHSGVAWYLTAEAEDASGNRAAARSALARAERYAPGLPFAQPDKVAALKAHLAAPAARRGIGVSPAVLVIGGLIILFILMRMIARARARRTMPPPGYPGAYPGNPPPYGPAGPPYGGAAPGVGGSLFSGIAAGLGFAAGERLLGGMAGPRDEAASGIDPAQVPERDDGLAGNPDWTGDNSGPDNDDTLNSGGDFDPGNNW